MRDRAAVTTIKTCSAVRRRELHLPRCGSTHLHSNVCAGFFFYENNKKCSAFVMMSQPCPPFVSVTMVTSPSYMI